MGVKALILKRDIFDSRYVKRERLIDIEDTAYTILPTDDVIIANSTNPITLTLPEASGTGILFIIKNINTGVLTLDGDDTDQIDGASTATLNQWDSITVVDYTTGKWIIV